MSLTAWCIVFAGVATVGLIGLHVNKKLEVRWRWEDIIVDLDAAVRLLVKKMVVDDDRKRSLVLFKDWLKERNGGRVQRLLSKDLLLEFEHHSRQHGLMYENALLHLDLTLTFAKHLEIDTHYLHDIIQKWLKAEGA